MKGWRHVLRTQPEGEVNHDWRSRLFAVVTSNGRHCAPSRRGLWSPAYGHVALHFARLHEIRRVPPSELTATTLSYS